MINIIGERASAVNVNPRKNHKLKSHNKPHYYFRIDHDQDVRLLLSDMKYFIFTFLAAILTFASQAQTNTATRYANELKNFALFGLIGTRCERYLPEQKHSNCQRTVASMLKLIDSAMIIPSLSDENHSIRPQAFIFIAFKTTLIELLEKKSTSLYLNDVLLKIRDENLWEVTLSHYPSPKMAAMVMAALFQDTSAAKLHLAYLQKSVKNPSETFIQNFELLEQTISTINQVLDSNPDYFQELLYPPGVKTNLNKNIYHFYVPLYLGHALLEAGATPEMSYIAPMLMTLTYEFVTASPDYRYIFSDPSKLDATKFSWKIKDISAGHQGAAMAVGKKNIKSLEFLKKSFSESTAKTVKALLLF